MKEIVPIVTHLRHFRWLPDGAGIINNQYIFFSSFFLKGRAPLGSKWAQGRPLVSEGCGALLKMPRRNTNISIFVYYCSFCVGPVIASLTLFGEGESAAGYTFTS
jgi:hypothetical protein